MGAGKAKLFRQKLFNSKQLSGNEFSRMKMLLKSFNKQRRAWLLVSVLLALFCRHALAQTIMVSNYPTFLAALSTSSVITNFQTNSIISLTTAGQHININKTVLIDGGTNGIVFDGNGLTRLFTVAANVQLTLNNLQLINGTSTNGGAIYNNGTLIISNCIIAGNSATNVSGPTGSSSLNGNGSSGGNGGTAEGGAIYSRGPVSIYYSVVGTNNALGGSGGSGGSGGNSLEFGGNGGNAGGGGSAYGAAVFSTGSNNVFFASQFLANICTAGAAGSGGAGGTGAFPSYGGTGAAGGSAAGGAVYVAGPVFVTNCLFAQNTLTAGASGADGSGNNNGFNGGEAEGGGVYISPKVTNAYLENSVFFNNTCTGGAGGSATAGSEDGGSGGSALGGGLASAAVLTTLRNCTLATNTLVAGAAGTGTTANGSSGGTGGWDIYRLAGLLKLSGSILSGGTNVAPNPMPNALGVTDAGYNISSDPSLVRAFGDTTLINSTNTFLDSGLADYGGPSLGPSDLLYPPAFLTLAIVAGSVATNFVPGVPGLSFPATDELGNTRGSPASAGAFELNPITIDSNAPPPLIQIDTNPTNQQADIGATVTFTVAVLANYDANNNSLGFQWQLNGTNLAENNTFIGATTTSLTIKNVTAADVGSYQVIVGVSLLENVSTSSVVLLSITTNAPRITLQPVSKPNVPNGSVVTFKVTATDPDTNSEPLSYQWYLGATPLSDTNEISGSATSILTINPATTNDEGLYSVVVTNMYGADTSDSAFLSIVADTTKPLVAFSSPGAGARTNNLVVMGTASDIAQVTNVNYWITNINAGSIVTNNGQAALMAGTGSISNWTIPTTALLPGTNYVTVQSADYPGNLSIFATREFFYKVPASFHLLVNPVGMLVIPAASVEGNAVPSNGATLYVGEGYTLTAMPPPNWRLADWLTNGSIAGTASSLIFIMEPDLVVTANFALGLPPSITTQPANQTEPVGGVAAFSVKATGASLTYQWLFDGAPVSDSTNISGSAASQLTIHLVAAANEGSYSVVVSNSAATADAVTSKSAKLTVVAEITKPAVAVTSPKANSRTNALVLSGTASDDVRVLTVAYWVTNLNNGIITTTHGLAALTKGTGSVSNWTIAASSLLPGTNILSVQSSNYSGEASSVVKATFFYEVTTPFHLLVNPEGMRTSLTNGAPLDVGEGYTLTAEPAQNWWLTNWLTNSSFAGSNKTLAFIMESNLVVTANFATNLFVGAAARYDGIFYPSDAKETPEATCGLIENLLLQTNGIYSGKLYLAGSSYLLAGAFNRSGEATETIVRTTAAGGNVSLELNIPWQSVPRQIMGSLRGTSWISSNLFLYAATTNTNNFPAYTVLLSQDTNEPSLPPDYGYALITNTGSMINMGGMLSDGTPFSRSEPINEQNQFPVYASLYNNKGLLLGTMSLDAATNGTVPVGGLTWFKPPLPKVLYSDGFDAGLEVEGSPWTNSEAALAGLFAGSAQLTFSGGSEASNSCMVQLTSSNTLRKVSGWTNFSSGSINLANGLMTLAYTNTLGKKVTAYGTVLQNTNLGGGFFLGATNAGTITLTP